MKTEYFTFKWSMTLFSCFLPKDVLVPIFDLFLINGWPYIYRIGVSLLNNFLQTRILQMDSMMAISQFFRDDMRNQRTFNPNDIHSIIQGSHKISITKSDLVKFKDDFYVGLAKQKLEEHSEKQLRNTESKPKKATFLGFETGLSIPQITKSGRKRRPVSQSKSGKPEENKHETQVFKKVQDKLQSMDPYVKESINKYQERLLKVDKQLEAVLSEKRNLERLYTGIKEDYISNIGKKTAIQSTLLILIEAYDRSLSEMAKSRTKLVEESKKHSFHSQSKNQTFAVIEETMTTIQQL